MLCWWYIWLQNSLVSQNMQFINLSYLISNSSASVSRGNQSKIHWLPLGWQLNFFSYQSCIFMNGRFFLLLVGLYAWTADIFSSHNFILAFAMCQSTFSSNCLLVLVALLFLVLKNKLGATYCNQACHTLLPKKTLWLIPSSSFETT